MIDLTNVLKSNTFCRALDIPPGNDIEFELLGAGEYNLNYSFIHPHTGKKLVLRIPSGSQMHLKNQICYEYKALELLQSSSRTPAPVYLDDRKTFFPYGFLVMEYLPGSPLVYETDLEIAARCLADIHNVPVPDNCHLIKPERPLTAILSECHDMAEIYLGCSSGLAETKQLINKLFKKGCEICNIEGSDHESRCIINTELNSGNFLINGSGKNNYLVDWEKPLLSYVGQDLGHFLAPTTTLWKTDTMLDRNQIHTFLEHYCRHSVQYSDPDLLWQKVMPYFMLTCLRGITWCAMAWVEYQSPDRPIKNKYTYEKIQTYLSTDFLLKIETEYMGKNNG